jgi:hypothetical protein
VASTLDGGLQYKSGIAAAIRPGVAGGDARALQSVPRTLGCSGAAATRTAIPIHIDATTPFTDGGRTAQ